MKTLIVDRRKTNVRILVASIMACVAIAAVSDEAHAVLTVYSPSVSEKQAHSSYGTAFGCLIQLSRKEVEVRVTSRAALRKAKRQIGSDRKFGSKRLVRASLVPKNQSLDEFLAAWIFALQTQPQLADTPTALASVGPSRAVPKKRKCQSIGISIVSWPGHTATSAQRTWAESARKAYPATIEISTGWSDLPPVVATSG